jgi:uncharacterized membrane protein YeaQ/YmgE (transglycosylase-associated protein family)
MDVTSGGLVAWLVAGLLAGWLASSVMKRSGHALTGDLVAGNFVLGILGAVDGGLLASALATAGNVGLLGRAIDGFGGAAILLACIRLLPDIAPSRRLTESRK